MNKKEQVKKAIHMQGPDYIPLMYSKTLKNSDVINVPVEMHFTGPAKEISEWGFKWDFLDKNLSLGQPKTPIIQTLDDFNTFKAPDPYDPSRFLRMKEAKELWGEERYFIGDLKLTGFTIMSLMRGFSDFLEDLYINPDEVNQLADKVFAFEAGIIRQLKEHGFDAVGLADDYGSQLNLFMPPKLWREVFKPRLKKHIELAHECGLDVFLHSCGYIYDIIPDLIEIGLDMLNPGQPSLNGIKRMGENFGGKICFVCPVSYQTTGVSGCREDIFNEVKEYVECLGSFNGGLIGLVNEDMETLGASPENNTFIMEAFEKYSKY